MSAPGGGTIGKVLTALSTPELSPPAPREGTRSLIAQDAMGARSSDDEAGSQCLACGREGDFTAICQRCAGRMKTVLLGDDEKKTVPAPGSGRQYYCLHCHKLFSDKHDVHLGMMVPLGWYKGKRVAWASGDEAWAPIFDNITIQSARDRPVRPYFLHKPKEVRCSNCFDLMTDDALYGCLKNTCCLKCWVAGSSDPATEAIVAMDFNQENAFCLTCRMGFQRPADNVHRGHDCLRVRTDSDGRRRWVVIPAGHRMEQVWEGIWKQGAGKEVLVRDDWTLRCPGCQTRLVDAGDRVCCLECSLAQKTQLVPRCLQLRALNAQKTLPAPRSDNGAAVE